MNISNEFYGSNLVPSKIILKEKLTNKLINIINQYIMINQNWPLETSIFGAHSIRRSLLDN